jgi:lipopolysaccharide transport system permease protein
VIKGGRSLKKPDMEIDISPEGGADSFWSDLWEYRELFVFLTWRDILARYKQTTIGVAWSVLRPIVTMVAFTVVFSRLAGLSAGDTPYPLMVYSALLPWQFFSVSLTESGNSLVNNSQLVTKVYFPRLIIPGCSVAVGLVDLLISMVVYVALMLLYQYVPDWRVVTLPLFLLLAIVASLGMGFWLSALTVKYRDFRHILPFLVQVGLYVSPVGFRSDIVPAQWRLIYSLNPMVGVIDGFRWALLGGKTPLYLPGVGLSVVLTLVVLWGGLRYFRRTERIFADVI